MSGVDSESVGPAREAAPEGASALGALAVWVGLALAFGLGIEPPALGFDRYARIEAGVLVGAWLVLPWVRRERGRVAMAMGCGLAFCEWVSGAHGWWMVRSWVLLAGIYFLLWPVGRGGSRDGSNPGRAAWVGAAVVLLFGAWSVAMLTGRMWESSRWLELRLSRPLVKRMWKHAWEDRSRVWTAWVGLDRNVRVEGPQALAMPGMLGMAAAGWAGLMGAKRRAEAGSAGRNE